MRNKAFLLLPLLAAPLFLIPLLSPFLTPTQAGPQQADPNAGLKEVAEGLRTLATKMEAIKLAPGSSLTAELKPVTIIKRDSGPFPLPQGKSDQKILQIPAPYKGWFLGGQMWLGLDRGAVVEAGLTFWAKDKEMLAYSPHKENGSVWYDSATIPLYFSQGYAEPVEKGEIISFVCFVSNTGQAPTNAHGMCWVHFGQ